MYTCMDTYVRRVFVEAHSGQQRALDPPGDEVTDSCELLGTDFWKNSWCPAEPPLQSLWPSLLSSLLLVLSLFFWVTLFPP